MRITSSAFIRHFTALFVGLAMAASVVAQTYPSKPVSIIVAFPPGGGSDVLGRAIGKGMAEVFGQPVIIENVVGVGGSLGVLKAAHAQPDGYTLLAGSPLELIYTPLGVAAAKNKPEDMRLAALVGYTPIAIAVRKDLPVNTLEEFVAYAKKADNPLSYGSTGMGSLYHLMAEKALQTAGARGLHAPYNGMAPYLKDLMGGVLDFAVVPLVGPVIGAIESGRSKRWPSPPTNHWHACPSCRWQVRPRALKTTSSASGLAFKRAPKPQIHKLPRCTKQPTPHWATQTFAKSLKPQAAAWLNP